MGKLLQFRPRSDSPRLALARKLYAEASSIDDKEPLRAESLYEKSLAQDPTFAEAWCNFGNMLYRRHAFEEAQEAWKHARQLKPTMPETHYNLGYHHLETGEPGKAIPLFKQALEYDPDFADCHFNLAIAHDQLRQRLPAKKHWLAYLRLEPVGVWSEVAKKNLAHR